MKLFWCIAVLPLLLTGCADSSKRVVCPALVDWPSSFQTELAGELEAYPATSLPAFHELALRAERQRAAVKGCK